MPNLDTQELCVGTKNRSLYDAIRLSALPGVLKDHYPSLKTYAYGRGYNAPVFKANPRIEGMRYLTRRVFGDHMEHQDFRRVLPSLEKAKPEIFLTEIEKNRARDFISKKLIPSNQHKPLCILHAWKSDGTGPGEVEYWDSIVMQWRNHLRFWQVGLVNDSAIQGCEYYFFQRRSTSNVRDLFSLISHAQLFIGISASPALAAHALNVPTHIPVLNSGIGENKTNSVGGFVDFFLTKRRS